MGETEFLRIQKNKSVTKISGSLQGFSFTDPDTGHIVAYIPSLEITGYGPTKEDAREMVEFSLKEYISSLADASIKEIKQELFMLGWRSEKLKAKVLHPNFDPVSKLKEEGIQDFEQTEIPLVA